MLPPVLQNHYVLAVHHLRESADFYVEMLGFKVVAEPPGWIFVARDNCMIMLGECPDDMPASALGCHNYFAYLKVADADAYYRHVKAKGGEVLQRSGTSRGKCVSLLSGLLTDTGLPSGTRRHSTAWFGNLAVIPWTR